jgi:2,4-dienoyl-CoA reductase-like NADH-dependent reductase (Old Yellow Enzyme family)
MEDWLLRAGTSLFGQWLVPPVPYEDHYFLEDACEVRREVRLPLVYVGGAASRPAIDRVLARGFDAVAMARALIADPAFVKRLAEEEGLVSACDHCNYCAARIYSTTMACHHREAPPPELAHLLCQKGAR